MGEPSGGAGLRDRRDRDQGRRPRPAAPPRRAARASPLGPGLQVGAVDRRDDAAQDPHPRRPDRSAQPLGGARARPRRRRHRLHGDPPQRGGHQPQGHPRGRPRDRPARRRRDPPGRRPGGGASQGDQAVPHAEAVPALRRRRRQARGRGHAPLPEPGVPFARPRDAHPLGQRRDGHRGGRRAVRAPALGRGPAPLDARSLPPHRRAARGARRLRRGVCQRARSPRSRRRRHSRSRASCSGSTSRRSAGSWPATWPATSAPSTPSSMRARRSSSSRRASGPTGRSSSRSGSPRRRTSLWYGSSRASA